jgi:signal transduction histidine kinase
MIERRRTKTQLLQENADLRRRLAALEETRAECHRTEESLRQTGNFLRGVIDAMPEVTIVVDRQYRVVLANRAARAMLGGEDPVSACLKCHQISHHYDLPCNGLAEPCPLLRVLEAKAPVTVTHTHFTIDGRQVTVEVTAAPIFDETGEVVRVLESSCDITALKEAQQKLVQAERLAAIGEAMAGLAHESRNALQRSQACLEMLATRVADRLDVLDLIDRIQAAQDHLHRLYEEVREYAAPIVLHTELRDVPHLVREAWQMLTSQRAGRQAILRESGAATAGLCQVDGFALQQVFRNVLENAMEACSEPIAIEVAYAPCWLGERPGLQIGVRDNGPGLTPEQARRIFDSFYTTKTKGTGLGMAIARRVVEAHGGRIAVGPPSPTGAEILIQLPRGTE